MKLNVYLLLFIFIIILNPTFSQQENCSHEKISSEENNIFYNSSSVTKKNTKVVNSKSNTPLKALPVVVQIVRKSNGETDYDLSEILSNIPKGIAITNKYNLPIGCRFYLAEIKYIDSDELYNKNEVLRTDFAGLRDLNSTNFFIVKNGGNFSSTPTSNTTPNAVYYSHVLFLNDVTFSTTSTLPHEVGHYFALDHTHKGTEGGNANFHAENVARTGAQSNCTITGDFLCDTPADPYSSGDTTDIHNVPYEIDFTNIMSYYRDTRTSFTEGQNQVMIEALEYRLNDTRYDLDGYIQTNIPNAPEITSISNTHLYNTITWTNTTHNMGYIIERSSESASSGFTPLLQGGTAQDIASYVDRDIESNTTYWYRVIPVNSENAYSEAVEIIPKNPNIYCSLSNTCTESWGFVPSSISLDDENQNLINMDTVSCNSNLSALDYSSKNLTPGATYTINIQQSERRTSFYNIFIDLNIDGDFDDENEWIVQNELSVDYIYYKKDFQLLTENITEGITAMRIIASIHKNINGQFPLSNACSMSLGFAQDFSINLSKTSSTWTGAENNDWTNNNNWNPIFSPTTTSNILIPSGLVNYPTLTAPVEANNITFESGTTLVTEGNTVTGNIIYKKNLNTNWHSISSPVLGMTYDDIKNFNLVVSPNTGNLGFAPYNNSGTSSWDYINTSSTGNLNPGQGYTIKLATSDDLFFSGTMNSQNIIHTVPNGDRTSFYLVGNPYTSYLDSDTFFTLNASHLDEFTLWVWNGTAYETISNLNPTKIAPAQGFFVKGSGDIIFSANSQSHQNNDTSSKQKAISNFELSVTNGTLKKYTKVFYKEDKTTGFDNGFDSSMLEYIDYNFTLYTELVSNNKGKKLAIQTLPDTKIETNIIPVGLIADNGEKIIFSVTDSNMPNEMKIVLEDRVNKKFINLSEDVYEIVLDEKSNGIGRFYIHTKLKENVDLNIKTTNIDLYKSSKEQITVSGLYKEATLTIYSIVGKEVFKVNFVSNGASKLKTPSLNTGIYIIKLDTEVNTITRKINFD